MKRVLLADDSMTIHKVVKLSFADEEEIEVIAVNNGTSALEKFAEVQPDIVLADILMPGQDGYEVCRRIKQQSPTTPVILLAGTFENFDPDRAEACGYNTSLTKPFETSKLIGLVTGLLERPPAAKSPKPIAAATAAAEPQERAGADFVDAAEQPPAPPAPQISHAGAERADAGARVVPFPSPAAVATSEPLAEPAASSPVQEQLPLSAGTAAGPPPPRSLSSILAVSPEDIVVPLSGAVAAQRSEAAPRGVAAIGGSPADEQREEPCRTGSETASQADEIMSILSPVGGQIEEPAAAVVHEPGEVAAGGHREDVHEEIGQVEEVEPAVGEPASGAVAQRPFFSILSVGPDDVSIPLESLGHKVEKPPAVEHQTISKVKSAASSWLFDVKPEPIVAENLAAGQPEEKDKRTDEVVEQIFELLRPTITEQIRKMIKEGTRDDQR